MEGKGETRLRNEQASENKVESQIPGKKRGGKEKTKILFFCKKQYFSENVFRAFQAPIRQPRSVQSPRSALSVPGPDRDRRFGRRLLFFRCLGGRSGSTVVVRLRRGEREKRNDGSSTHQPITTSHPNHFARCRFCGECRRKGGVSRPLLISI